MNEKKKNGIGIPAILIVIAVIGAIIAGMATPAISVNQTSTNHSDENMYVDENATNAMSGYNSSTAEEENETNVSDSESQSNQSEPVTPVRSSESVKAETAEGTHVYDFSTGAGTDKWAYEGGVDGRSPTTVNEPSDSIHSYSAISADDGTYESYVTTSDGTYAAQRFIFHIDEDPANISAIYITWNGKGWHDSGGAYNGTFLYIWNGTAYEELASSAVGTETTLTGGVTSGISNYINANNVTVLVEQKSAQDRGDASHIATDYIKLEVVTTSASDHVLATLGLVSVKQVKLSSSSSPTTIYVNTTGWWRPGGAFNESSNPIQSAVSNASDGDTIFVYNGTYILTEPQEWQISVNTPNLTLKGEGADVVTLDGNGADTIIIYLGPTGYGYSGAAPGCVVEGFRFTNATIGIGVEENSPNCIIRGNIFTVGGTGISVHAENTTVMGNIIDGGKTKGGNPIKGSNCTIVDNIIKNTTGSYYALGIYGKECTIVNNTITNNKGAGLSLNYEYSVNNTIVRNNITSNEYAGIELYKAGSYNKIYLNNIVDNGKTATTTGTTAPAVTYWNSTEPIEYVWNGTTYTGYLGNYWGSDYTGSDSNGDGIGDTPYEVPDNLGYDYNPLIATFENYPPPAPWYYKPSYPNYAPSGMPDFDQKQDNWKNAAGQWTFCGPTAVANCFWWFDSKYANPNGVPGDGADTFPLVSNYNASDDHDPSNVDDATTPPGPNGELIERLAWCMDTDGMRTGIPHNGTKVTDMQACIDNWLNDTGLQNNFYEHTVKAPTFEYIEAEVERSEDVILLLGFWHYDEVNNTWCRVGGHYVTVAGVNSGMSKIAFSDPFLDIANASASPTEHNDAANVSHDIYSVGVIPIPQLGDVTQITDYPANVTDVYQNFAGQNVPDELEPYQCPSEVPDVAVVEYAVIISPKCVPGIEVSKTVWNGSAWVKETTANLGDTLRFRIWIHNNGTCCNLTSITVVDILSDSLNYSDNATVNGESQEPVQVAPNEYLWELPGPLAPCENITIEFNATVVRCPAVDTNTVNVTAWCNDTMVADEDSATVAVLSTPFVIYGWVNYSNGTAVLNPNVTITNLNTSEVFTATTSPDSNYYQVSTTSCNISAGDVLHFNVSDTNTTEFNHTVTQDEIDNGGFMQNITIIVAPVGLCGDVDCDGEVTMGDGRQIWMNIIYGADEYPLNCCQ